jgi:integrase
VQYRIHGRERRYSLGRVDFSLRSLAAVRDEARQALAIVARGGDPAEQRRSDREALTFKKLAERYYEEHSLVTKRRPGWDRAVLDNLLVPRFGRRRAKDIRRRDVERLKASMRDRPGYANRALKLLGSIFSKAIEWEELTENPVSRIKHYREEPRTRRLSRQELDRLWPVLLKIEGEGGIAGRAAAACQLSLLCGMRIGEAKRLRWDAMDDDARVLWLTGAQTKTEKPRAVHLGAPAVALLKRQPRVGEWVFPSSRPDRPLRDIRDAWERICSDSEIENLQPRDLRRSHGSLLLQGGAPIEVVRDALGHGDVRITQKVYAFLGDDPVRQAQERLQEQIAASVNPPADVMEIQR